MMGSIEFNKPVEVRYGKLQGVPSRIVQCNNIATKISDGIPVTLAKLTNAGLKVIESRIGEVVKQKTDSVEVIFNTDIEYNNILYAMIISLYQNREPSALVVAYEELE